MKKMEENNSKFNCNLNTNLINENNKIFEPFIQDPGPKEDELNKYNTKKA